MQRSVGQPTVTSAVQVVALSRKWRGREPPLLGAALLTALYTRMATAALSSWRAGAPVTLQRAQSPCALCRGDRACFVGKEPREAGGLARPLGLMPRERVSRGGACVRQYLAAFSPVKGPSRGESPREARQAWRAWSLAGSEAASVMSSRGEVPHEGKTLARLARLGEPGPW